ncbi:MAG TPA: lysophospholipid acyltransferase family protein [Chthonomonadaceae bacterium]|nr:lysophospholipid acyltransferase family protein [Chthonomonadaceae bacterium]
MANQTTLTPETTVPLRKRVERTVGRVALQLVIGPIRAMPWPMARSFGRGLGAVAYRIFGKGRRVAYKNLALVYGEEKTEAERRRMAREVFRHFGQWGTEFLKLPHMSRTAVDRLVTVAGEANLCAALEKGKGVLLVTGHFGNWEFMGRWLATHGYALNVVARDARDPAMTKLQREIREGNGATVLYRGNSARAVLQCLRKNEIVALLPDQNAADVFVPFLGQPTGTVDGPAVIHLKTSAPLLFSWCTRTPDDRFHLEFEPPVVIAPTGEREADIATVMTEINARLGAQIRRNPTQWLWLHDRWKASPGVFPEGAANVIELKTPIKKALQEKQTRP